MTWERVDEEEIKRKLGVDRLPDPRLPVPHELPTPGKGDLVNYRKALELVDIIETAAFEKYLPDDVVIDQTVDTRAFDPGSTRAISIRTDMPIPSNYRIFRSTGIGREPNSHNYYLWMAQEIKRHVLELGACAISRPYIFRVGGQQKTVPFIGAIFKVIVKPKDGQTELDMGARWGLLTPKSERTLSSDRGEN